MHMHMHMHARFKVQPIFDWPGIDKEMAISKRDGFEVVERRLQRFIGSIFNQQNMKGLI